MTDVLCLYLDDSGTRNPDHDAGPNQFRDWFGLGGILFREEDETRIRQMHAEFCANWGQIKSPLHSVDIRHKAKGFSWLRTLCDSEYTRFMKELTSLMVSLPVSGHACVIDRPGYDAEYRPKYGRQTWMLCKTSFTVLVERAAKIAMAKQCRLRVYPEQGDKSANACLEAYYKELLADGMPFAANNSEKYGPMSAEDFRRTLYGFKFKRKSSPPMQLADLYLYPICRGRYQPEYRPYDALVKSDKLIDSQLAADQIEKLGIKYSRFELVDAENTKAGIAPGSGAASITETS